MPDKRWRARSYLSRPQLKPEVARNLARHGHHIAIAVALAMAILLALLFPFIDGSSQASQERTVAPVIVSADGRTYTLDSEAETVVDALAEAGVTIGPKDSILRNGVPVDPRSPVRPPSALASSSAAPGKTPASPIVLSLRRAVPFTIHTEGFSVYARSSRATVAEALAEAGIELGPGVQVAPDLKSPLSAGLHIYVYETERVTLFVGKQQLTIHTLADTVADLLRQQGVELDGQGHVSPALDTTIRSGMTIRVTFVGTETEVAEEIIPYEVIYRDDPSYEIGFSMVIDPGSDGYIRREYQVTYENGDEVGYKLLSEEVIWPTDRVIVRGTKLPPNALPLPDGTVVTYSRSMTVYATWYNAASSGGDGITATGAPLDKGVVAVDPSVIPLGTRMYVPGYGYAVAADTGHGVIGNMIDLGYPGDTIGTCCTGFMTIYILD